VHTWGPKSLCAGAKSPLGCGEMVVSEPGYVAEFGRSKLNDMVGCENELQASMVHFLFYS